MQYRLIGVSALLGLLAVSPTVLATSERPFSNLAISTADIRVVSMDSEDVPAVAENGVYDQNMASAPNHDEDQLTAESEDNDADDDGTPANSDNSSDTNGMD